jgi:hypothetical protein
VIKELHLNWSIRRSLELIFLESTNDSTSTECHGPSVPDVGLSTSGNTFTKVDSSPSFWVLGGNYAKTTGAHSVAWSGMLFLYTHTSPYPHLSSSCQIKRVGNVALAITSITELGARITRMNLTSKPTLIKRAPNLDISLRYIGKWGPETDGMFGFDLCVKAPFSAESSIGIARIFLCVENGLICVMNITQGP